MKRQTRVALAAGAVLLAAVGVGLTFVRAPLESSAPSAPPAPLADAASSSAAASVAADGGRAGQTSTASAAAALAPSPGIASAVDWTRYPGTLHTQIQQALQAGDGVMAADLARKLRACEIAARMMRPEAIERVVAAGGGPGVEAIRDADFQANQRVLANCQTVVGDPGRLQLALLDVAIAQGVFGAAVESFHLGQRRPEVLHGMVRDAIAGDVFSLVQVTAHKPSLFGISSDTQGSLRYAFELAARDPDVGTLVRPYVGIAESLSVPMGGEARSSFNHEGLTDSQRANGQATARLVIARVNAPK